MIKDIKQTYFKQKLVITFLFMLFSFSISAQCYKSNLDVGKQQYNSGKYQTAMTTFQKSLKCPDAKGGSEANQWITKCKSKITEQKNIAEQKRISEERKLAEEKRIAEENKLKIGEYYAGGIIFYLDYSGKHGKVCATYDQTSRATWDEAKQICFSLTLNGYSDWYLPSKDELYEMYINIHLKNLGGFAYYSYWSSSETNADYAWVQYFANGYQLNYGKSDTKYVRAVRAF